MSTVLNRKVFLVFLVLLLVTVVAYYQVFHCDFLEYDDGVHVTNNPNVNQGLSVDSVFWAFKTLNAPRLGHWQPVTWISHMLDCEFFGLNPSWHHLHNLLIHVINVLLLFWILRRMTGAVWRSFFVAVLFGIHPLRVESVAWITERRDVLSGMFFMLTVASYIRYIERRSFFRYLLMALFLALGLMSKSMLVTVPFVLLLLDFWPLDRFGKKHEGKFSFFSLIIEKIPLFVLVAGSCVVALIAAQEHALHRTVGIIYSMSNAFISYVTYIIKMFYPARLAVMYPLQSYIPGWKPIASVLFLIFVTVFVFMGRRKRYLPVGWFWYLGMLVPIIGFVQIGDQAIADRYTYLPLIGLSIMFTWGVSDILGRWRSGRIFLGICSACLVLAMVVGTMLQVRYWKDSFSLFKRSSEVTKNNYIMLNNYGSLLLARGRTDEAFGQFEKALRANPEHAKAHCNIGIVFYNRGEIDNSIASYKRAIEIDPEYVNAHYRLGQALSDKGQIDEAIEHFHEVLRLDPKHPMVNYHLAAIYHKRGDLEQMVKHCIAGLAVTPGFVELRINLARTLSRLGRMRECVEQYYKVLEYQPERIDVLDHLARILATSNDPEVANAQDALKFAELACSLQDYKNAYLLDTLGIAYAASGDFDNAIKYSEQAIQRAGGDKKLSGEVKKRIELYKSGRPYKE